MYLWSAETVSAIESASTFALDPMLTIVASAFGGALLTAFATVFTFIWAGRREHKKWLKDMKYETYAAQIAPLETLNNLISSDDTPADVSAQVFSTLSEINTASLTLIASAEVSSLHTDVLDAMTEALQEREDTEAMNKQPTVLAMERLINAMRHDLVVPAKQTKRTKGLK